MPIDKRQITNDKWSLIGALVLAAGASSRMGRPKQILRYEGESLIRRSILAALGAGCRPVVVVTGANAKLTRDELNGLDVSEVINPDWETGMASSIRAGIKGLISVNAETSAVVVMLCDQPLVTVDVILQLISAHRTKGSQLVASTYGESFGVPALFGRELFDELSMLDGPAGAKQIINRHAPEAEFLPFPGGDVDVDTPEEFSRLTGQLEHAETGIRDNS